MQHPNSPIRKVYGIAQPIKSTEKIWKRALELEQVYAGGGGGQIHMDRSVHIVTVDQSDIHTLIQERTEQAMGIKSGDFSSGQLKSYMRTPVGFFSAQLLSQSGYPCIVLGTGNYDEDGYLYYFCKAGDGVADVQLIADLHKSEVFKVGKELNVPSSILGAPPSADLWAGKEFFAKDQLLETLTLIHTLMTHTLIHTWFSLTLIGTHTLIHYDRSNR